MTDTTFSSLFGAFCGYVCGCDGEVFAVLRRPSARFSRA